MRKYRIRCTECKWATKPHFLQTECIREKEVAHKFGIVKFPDRSAHDAAFGSYCPECGADTITEHKFFK